MARATGVGGVFFRATDPTSLSRWYMDVLGLPASEQSYIVLPYEGGETLTWSVFPEDTDYFGPSGQTSMINYRVDDLDGVLQRLRAAGAEVDEHIEEHEYGRFGWAVDPEGNRFELWQPAEGN